MKVENGYLLMTPGESLALSPAALEHKRAICAAQNEQRLTLSKSHSNEWVDWWRKIRADKNISPECVLVFNGKELVCVKSPNVPDQLSGDSNHKPQ